MVPNWHEWKDRENELEVRQCVRITQEFLMVSLSYIWYDFKLEFVSRQFHKKEKKHSILWM